MRLALPDRMPTIASGSILGHFDYQKVTSQLGNWNALNRLTIGTLKLRDCLSDSHRDFMTRYIEAELQRQEELRHGPRN